MLKTPDCIANKKKNAATKKEIKFATCFLFIILSKSIIKTPIILIQFIFKIHISCN